MTKRKSTISQISEGVLRPATIIVLPERPNVDVEELIDACRKRAVLENCELAQFRSEHYRFQFTKPIEVLDPLDAYSLYRKLHSVPAVILTFNMTYVRIDPSSHATARNIRPLSSFVRYKGGHHLIRSHSGIDSAFSELKQQTLEVECTGENDPRILPFHSFETKEEWTNLSDVAEVERFELTYGRPSFRTDDGGRKWKRANRHEYHGADVQTVAGRVLPEGLHWDLTTSADSVRLFAPHEVWQLRGQSAYLNIYPNGHIRSTSQTSLVRKVFIATKRQQKR
jgi:hypothetical protein